MGDGQLRLSNRLDCHIYLIDGGRLKALIDCGAGVEPERIVANIREDGLDPKGLDLVILTHSHPDHAGGAKFFQEECGAEILVPEPEQKFLEAPQPELEEAIQITKRTGIYPEDYQFTYCKADRALKDQETLDLGRYQVQVIVVPGHSPGIAALLLTGEGRRALFSSDILFFGGTIGLGNWPTSSLKQYRENIGRLAGLRVEELYPGHFLWTLEAGQEHIDRAVEALQLAWPPPMWSHQHPAY